MEKILVLYLLYLKTYINITGDRIFRVSHYYLDWANQEHWLHFDETLKLIDEEWGFQ